MEDNRGKVLFFCFFLKSVLDRSGGRSFFFGLRRSFFGWFENKFMWEYL